MDVLRPKGWIRATQNAGVASGGYYTYEKIMSGNFYLGVSLDEESMYGGNVSDWYDGHGALSLNFYLGFMPADDMTIKDIKNTPGIQSNMWNGMTWDTNFYIPFTNKNSKEILKTPTTQFESMDQYLVICSDRKNAIKLRKLIIDIFMEKIVIDDSDKTTGGSIQKLKELLLDVTGSNETFSQIQESVKNISINSFFHD